MLDFALLLCHALPMFIRENRTKNRKTDAVYTCHKLVESYRSEAGPRQRVVMDLGSLSLPKSEWRKLAAVLEARLAGQVSLFEAEPLIALAAEQAMQHFDFRHLRVQDLETRKADKTWIPVDLQSVETMESRSLGPELVGHTLWQRLKMPEFLTSLGWSRKEMALAEAVVVGRLVAPSSDLATWSWLRERTALVELLEEEVGQVGKDAVYEVADKLLQYKSALEGALRSQENLLFGQTATLFLYDLTNLYMEGSAAGNTLAKRGHSKEKRTDCPLITLALLVDEFGFPLMSEIYAGNQSEPETLEDIVKRLEQQHRTLLDQGTMTFVMDRGIATRENVTLLQEKGYPYIVVERRPVHKAYEREFAQARETFERIDHRERKEEAVYTRKVMMTDDVAHVLCLSEGRAQKERAMDRLKEGRFLEDVGRLQTAVRKGNIVLVPKVEQRVGRLKEKYPSIARYYDVEVVVDASGRRAADVVVTKRPSREERSRLTGCYVMEAYGPHATLSSAAIWQLYMTLHRVEDAFRALKTDLGIRPVYHQTAERTKAHLFISVLAYHLLAVVERQLREHEDTRRWQTICKELGTHQRSTVVVTDDQDRVHHIRVSGKPEAVHRDIYKKLNIADLLGRSHRIVERRL